MTDKMREDFEVWYEGVTGSSVKFNDVGIPVSIGSELSDTTTMCMWLAWRASRESLCVEIPTSGEASSFGNYVVFDSDAVREILDAAGVRHK